jgi:hypothetical protein
VAVPAAAGLQIYTSQWQNVTSTGTITAAFVFIGRYTGGGYDGYDALVVTNSVANPIPGAIALSPASLSFTAPYNGITPADQFFSVSNSGALAYGYTNSVTYGSGAMNWLSVNATTGTLAGALSQTHTATVVSIAGLNAGTYSATNTVTSVGATNSPQAVIVSLAVTKVTPGISWSNPSAMTYGTALSGVQLDASSATPGTFAYNPISGTVLNPGSNTVQAVLSPTDSANYNTATGQVTIVVNPTISITAGAHGTVVPGSTVTVPYGGATNIVVSSDPFYRISSIVTNGVAVPAAAGLQIYTSQWQNVTSTGTMTAAFVFIGRYTGGGYDGYDFVTVTNSAVSLQETQGSVYTIR